MKKITLTKLECDFLLHCLEELSNIADDSPIEDSWLEKINKTKRYFNLEMQYFKIKNNADKPTKKEMAKWLKIKVQNKISDFN